MIMVKMIMKKESINSHIQMPKCILKRFEDANHRFCYYDVEKNIIGTGGHAKSLNTQIGYYSLCTEAFLNSNVEKPLSDFLKEIDAIDFDQDVIIISSPKKDAICTFIYSLIARSPSILSKANEYEAFWSLLCEHDRHDFAAEQGIILAQEKKLLNDYRLTFTYNKSVKPFVLPMIGMYSFIFHGLKHIIIPISPRLAITLIENDSNNHKENQNILQLYYVEDTAVIDQYNILAFNTQCREKAGYVVSHNKQILEELRKRTNENINGGQI